jgi:hypothetical protein
VAGEFPVPDETKDVYRRRTMPRKKSPRYPGPKKVKRTAPEGATTHDVARELAKGGR